jgi:sarcosine oxidase
MIGPADGMVVAGTLRSAREYGLAHEFLSPDEIHKRFPTFALADDLVAVIDPRAGYLDPEASTAAHLNGARLQGAEIHFDEAVASWSVSADGVHIETNAEHYSADRVLFSAGGWTKRLIKDLELPLTVERQVAFWLDPDESVVSYDTRDFPIFAHEFSPGLLSYGFPRLPRGVKASIMHGGELSESPVDVRRSVDKSDLDALRGSLRPVVPGLAESPVLATTICLFTNTPDHDFIIDFHPEFPRVLISSPCSGHGFKFASVIGEVQADLLTTGKSRFDLSPFRIGRFQ